MALRTGHGNGAGMPRIEVLPPDELPPATGALAVRPDRGHDGRFTAGNTVGRMRRVRPDSRGLPALPAMSPAYAPFARWGRRYGAHRRRELAQAHGGEISAGVAAIIESAALAMAASRSLQSVASLSGDVEIFRQSSQLASTARQHELAAWELAARERAARPKPDPYAAESDEPDADEVTEAFMRGMPPAQRDAMRAFSAEREAAMAPEKTGDASPVAIRREVTK
jgi:hypothetical protein